MENEPENLFSDYKYITFETSLATNPPWFVRNKKKYRLEHFIRHNSVKYIEDTINTIGNSMR